MERAKGIEPSSSAWKADALPLSYARVSPNSLSNLWRLVNRPKNYGSAVTHFAGLRMEAGCDTISPMTRLLRHIPREGETERHTPFRNVFISQSGITAKIARFVGGGAI